MVIGIGTDIIEISRISKACESVAFLNKCFTTAELELFKGRKTETIAGNFACKESLAKAFGLGFRGFSIKEIEILRDEQNKPEVFLYGKALVISKQLNVSKIHATISHCNEYATAFVLLEAL